MTISSLARLNAEKLTFVCSRFALICSRAAWRQAAAEAAAKTGLRIDVVVISARAEYRDVGGTWSRLRQIDASGAVLVRPDARVAWQSQGMSAGPADSLVDAHQNSRSRSNLKFGPPAIILTVVPHDT